MTHKLTAPPSRTSMSCHALDTNSQIFLAYRRPLHATKLVLIDKPRILDDLRLEDFEAIIKHAELFEPGDDLVGMPNPIAWPVTTREDAQQRLTFVMRRQKQRFIEDPSAKFIKVVDAASADDIDTGDIISLARWHLYPTGYDYATQSHWEEARYLPDDDWPAEFNYKLHDFILTERDRARAGWIGVGKPIWVLTHLVTRKSQRGRGAAGMLITWGTKQSDESGIASYLEAGAQGRPIYERYGFRQVGKSTRLDLQPFGLDMNIELVNMMRVSGGNPNRA